MAITISQRFSLRSGPTNDHRTVRYDFEPILNGDGSPEPTIEDVLVVKTAPHFGATRIEAYKVPVAEARDLWRLLKTKGYERA